ncbi:MAG: RNB domain-containing ribonuclease [Slackia sp.]|nr:RNB domain-containing ribonuclease [Slackia sp.]
MPRSRSRKTNTRRTPRTHPRGVLEVCGSGYGFVQTAEGEFYVPASKIADAFDGDFVEVARVGSSSRSGARGQAVSERPVARVVRVISRAHEFVVGRYEVAEPFGVVVPEDPRIRHDVFTLRREAPHVQDGDIVRVRMTAYPSRHEPAQGVVEEVLGHAGDSGIDVELIIARHKLETHFPAAALEQARAMEHDASSALCDSRYRDLTNRVVFTIDPDDAKDFDDALSLERFDDGSFVLGVHIADVSHYVPWSSAIDATARRRATSVYLVDRVIPMLPEELSNDICSLKPGELRRVMSVDMRIAADGSVGGHLSFGHSFSRPSDVRPGAGMSRCPKARARRRGVEGSRDECRCPGGGNRRCDRGLA